MPNLEILNLSKSVLFNTVESILPLYESLETKFKHLHTLGVSMVTPLKGLKHIPCGHPLSEIRISKIPDDQADDLIHLLKNMRMDKGKVLSVNLTYHKNFSEFVRLRELLSDHPNIKMTICGKNFQMKVKESDSLEVYTKHGNAVYDDAKILISDDEIDDLKFSPHYFENCHSFEILFKSDSMIDPAKFMKTLERWKFPPTGRQKPIYRIDLWADNSEVLVGETLRIIKHTPDLKNAYVNISGRGLRSPVRHYLLLPGFILGDFNDRVRFKKRIDD